MPESASPTRRSTVYGPVRSWRYGRSLGIDPIVHDSICSFNCVYCQLGEIHQVVDEQRLFVPTSDVVEDLARVDMAEVDIVTLSGSGEPTLALNIGEIIDHVRERHDKPVLVLTNATWLHDAATRERLRNASIVDCKLDAASDETLRRIDRPAPGITIDRILSGIRAMRREPHFAGRLTLQCMLLGQRADEIERLAHLIREIAPDEVQLNTPLRPRPEEWYFEARGHHGKPVPVPHHMLRTVSPEEAGAAADVIRGIAGVPVRTVFDRTV